MLLLLMLLLLLDTLTLHAAFSTCNLPPSPVDRCLSESAGPQLFREEGESGNGRFSQGKSVCLSVAFYHNKKIVTFIHALR